MTALLISSRTAAQGRRIMPIGNPVTTAGQSAVRRLSGRLLSFRDAGRRSPADGRAVRFTATIGHGNGHAARGQVARSGGRITSVPGPGHAGDAEPMARRAENWIRACDCAFC